MRQRLVLAFITSLLLVFASSCGKGEPVTNASRGEACVAQRTLGEPEGSRLCAAELACCNGVCAPSVRGGCSNCTMDSQCASEECCAIGEEGAPAREGLGVCIQRFDILGAETTACAPRGPDGGPGNDAGPGGDAGLPLDGGSDGGPAIPAHTVVSGNPTVDANGCLSTIGAGVLPATIALTAPLTADVATVFVEGTLAPVPAGLGIDGVSIVQTCTGGVINGASVQDCPLARASHNILAGTGSVGIFTTAFVEAASSAWTPPAPSNPFALRVIANRAAQTVALNLAINGVEVATANAGSLGAAGGTVVTILLAQARVCRIRVTQ